MNFSDPSNLAIIACPGGEAFTGMVISHLQDHYQKKSDKILLDLAMKYSLDQQEVIRRINFIKDASALFSWVSNSLVNSPGFQIQTPVQHTLFPNGELKAEIGESIRGKDVYIVQDTENNLPVSYNKGTVKRPLSVNDHLMTVLVTVDAALQAGAGRITLVLPIYPYSRQHQKSGREGVTASLVGHILEDLGVNSIITLDIHSREIGHSFKKIRVENLHASYQIIRALAEITDIYDPNLVVVAPDTGAVNRNRFYANAMKKPLAMLYKERDYSQITKNAAENNISEIRLLGNVENKTAFIADDMLGTGGTLLKAMEFLKGQGAGKVICAISLPLFTGKAIEYFDKAFQEGFFDRIIGTNAIYHEEVLTREWYESVDITKLFAETISRLHESNSVSSLLDNRDIINQMLKQG